MKTLYLFVIVALLVVSCVSEEKTVRKQNLTAEYIFRSEGTHFFTSPAPKRVLREKYPWEETFVAGYPRITKEFFRCKGNPLNPTVVRERSGQEPFYYRDCQGGHGLPLRDNQEFVYPCLLKLLNYIQEQTEKQVVITTGHRCPKHNAYADYSSYNWGSKHMLGAEVDFYVKGMEEEPEMIIELVKQYYQEHFPDNSDLNTFVRYEKGGLNVSTPPWYNREVFIKLYLKEEGRDFDNRHSYCYIGIQVRHDADLNERVVFDEKKAQNYLHH